MWQAWRASFHGIQLTGQAAVQFLAGLTELPFLARGETCPAAAELLGRLAARSSGFLRTKEGTLYPILYRLEDDGFISSSWQTGGAARTAPKKIYTATAAGRRALLAMQEEWRALCRCVQACGNVLAPEGDGGNVQT